MSALPDKRYKISEVSEITGVATHLLRQWESKIPQLRPRRDRSNRRYYTLKEIDIVKRINYLVRHEGLTLNGTKIRLAQELHGEGRPKTNQDVVDLLDKIETETRAIQNLLDRI